MAISLISPILASVSNNVSTISMEAPIKLAFSAQIPAIIALAQPLTASAASLDDIFSILPALLNVLLDIIKHLLLLAKNVVRAVVNAISKVPIVQHV